MTASAAVPEPGGPRRAHRRTRRWASTLTGIAVLASVLLIPPTPAAAAPRLAPATGAAGAGNSALTVSVPPAPVPVHPGQEAAVVIRLINQGTDPVRVTLSDRGAELGDNGSVQLMDQADPLWAGRVTFPAGEVTIPGQDFLPVSLQIRVPQSIHPDLYFLGLVVTPAPTKAGSVQVVNQIGALITLDVPGPRQRELSAVLDTSPVQLSGTATGTLQVRNPGRSVVRFFGENNVTASPGGGTPQQYRIDSAILPAGRQRSFPVAAPSSWPIELVTMDVRLSYPDQTESQTTEVTASADILLIQPWVPIVAALTVLTGVTILLLRRFRPRARGRARPVASGRGRRVMRTPAN